MKKKILSLIKNSYTKSFILGIALSFVIGFSISSVMAAAEGGGESSDSAFPFIESGSELVDRIGSLTVQSLGTASWIDPDAPGRRGTCLTKSASSGELESCLSVSGEGAFSKLAVLGMPAFISGSLFLNDTGNTDTLNGLPSGLVIEDFSGDDDSIMATSLQYENPVGIFNPRDFTTKRTLCAQGHSGVLYPCTETVDYSCVGVLSNATLCANDDQGLTADTTSILLGDIETCSSPEGSTPKCEYQCNNGYHESGGSCILDNYQCQGQPASNATLCPSDDQGLTEDTGVSTVDTCGAPKCEYQCNNGYHESGGSCVADTYSCIGSTTDHSTICSGDDQNLTADTNVTLVSSCGVPKCEYICDNNYHLEGGTCVPDGTPPVAQAEPVNFGVTTEVLSAADTVIDDGYNPVTGNNVTNGYMCNTATSTLTTQVYLPDGVSAEDGNFVYQQLYVDSERTQPLDTNNGYIRFYNASSPNDRVIFKVSNGQPTSITISCE